MNNTADNPKFDPVWGDLDNQFYDPDNYELEEVFDDMVSRQAEIDDLKEPCPEAQELINQWALDDDRYDYMQHWRAAVARRNPGISIAEGSAAEDAGPRNLNAAGSEDTPKGCSKEPEFLNDAEILGTEPDGLADFLARNASFLIGEMWGQRDRRNTQDTEWKTTTMPWGAWIGGQPGDKNTPAWGFSRHPVGKDKAGASIVLGSSVGGARKAKAMDTMFAMGLDIDSGASLDDTLTKIEELDLLCFAYTSFNHGKTGLELKRDDVLRKLQITRDPTLEEVRDYLREHDKHRYEETFIAECSIKEQKHQSTEGVKIVLDTPPLDKFRLLFPLAEPVKLIDLAETHQAALDLWEDKITGLARNVLGVHFDVSCTDASRLFYTARHPKGSDNWYAAIVMGEPLVFDSIQPMKKAAYTSNRDDNPFTQAGAETEGARREYKTPSGASLNEWHSAGGKNRFMIAELLETLCADKIRVAGGEAQGHVHIECPFESEHTTEGGTATMAINCLDSQSEYWTIFCHHDACQGRHKLEFLEEMLRQGWFEESALWDVSQGFLLEVEDGEDDPFAPLPGDLGDETKTPEQRAEGFTNESTDDDIRKFIKRLFREGVDMTTQANITAIISKNTNLGKRDVKKFWKELDDAQRRRERAEDAPTGGILLSEDAPELTKYAKEAIRAANEMDPFLFEYMEDATIVRRGRIKSLDRPGKRHTLGKVTKFMEKHGEGYRHTFPPFDVVDDLFSSDLSEFCLPLRGAVDTPFFAADGTLVTENGYHARSEMYLDSKLDLAGVSPHPTAEEVQAAKRFIVENVLADFPLGGLTRSEIMESLEGGPVPAVTHAMGLTLLPFMREMIDGPTPGWILSKPAAGTGASLLVKLLTTIASGVPAPESTLPSNKEEVPKTLTSLLQNDPTHIVFDNINHSVDSGELASMQTARTYQARILGKSQTIEVDVRSVVIFTANNVTLSKELLRRSIFITLDSHLDDPEMRTGFLHAHVDEWVDENRARLVHACLTIIQNWVAQGMRRSEHHMASFENWAAVTGGVLEAAGMSGFLEGQKEARALAADAAQENVSHLMDVLADFPDNTLLRPGGTAKFNGEKTVNLVDILNGEERAKIEPGDDKPDPIQIKSWGYSDHDGCYKTGGRVRPGFSKLARKPHRGRSGDGREYIMHFEELYDSKNKGVIFKMTKAPAPVSDGK